MKIRTRYVSRYIDPSMSTLDPLLVLEQKKVRKDITAPVSALVALADELSSSTVGSRRQEILVCMNRYFTEISKGRFIQNAKSDEDYFFKDWMISSLAITYLKAGTGLSKLPNSGSILRWFHKQGSDLLKFHQRRAATKGINNHYYWGGVAVSAVGVLCNDHKLISFGISTLKTGLQSISDQGTLEAELRRGKLALHYHAFAAVPMAATAAITRTHLTGAELIKLQRLVGAIVTSKTDREGGVIGSIVGIPQIEINDSDAENRLMILRQYADVGEVKRQFASITRNAKPYDFFLGGNTQFLIDRGQLFPVSTHGTDLRL